MYCITLLCRNAQLHCHRHHLETLCRRTKGCTFYKRPCIDGTLLGCSGMPFLDKCIHVTNDTGKIIGAKFIPWEKLKPRYVKINKTHNTCFCRYHIEYSYYYDTYIHILCVLHNTLVQECSTTLPLTSSREFIHSILCRRTEGCTFYQRPCVDRTFPRCGGMAIFGQMHTCHQ